MDPAKKAAIEQMKLYLLKCGDIYISFEKNTHYRWAIREAIREIKASDLSVLDTLENRLKKYDTWAHKNKPNSYIFSVCAAAIDDIIDLLSTY